MISDADLISCFSLDGFAVNAMIFDSLTTLTVPVFFSEGSDRVEMYDIAVEAVEPNLIARTADVAGVSRGWGVTVANGNFTVERIQAVGTGVSVLYLKRIVGD